ncbi:Crp/Fnr family transcriptional regulator [Gandjariella thermophila]|uniref:Crp/Fnr family transcriptional regulator n=1 Tax=Gandjariella thermophila TaxID=1931992 RepID=UPI0010F4D43E|nr:Crp/Fnr family transcriptional regulator [Gandjariella thermophila]
MPWEPDTFVGRLHPDDRRDLLALGSSNIYPANRYLLVEGDRSQFVLVLHGGPAKVAVHDERGGEYVLGLRGRGDLIGELSYLDGRPRSASVVALRPLRATKIAWSRFDQYLQDRPAVGLELARCVGSRLRDADRSRLAVSTDDVAMRLARLLRDLAGEPGERRPERAVAIEASQGELAKLVHAAEVTVNRVLREFRAQGLVRTAYRRVLVPCLVCLDRLVLALAEEQKDGRKAVRGCGGRAGHGSR